MSRIVLFISSLLGVFALASEPVQRLDIPAGIYQKNSEAAKECPDGQVHLVYGGSADNQTLQLGENITFAHIEKDGYRELGFKDCSYDVETRKKTHEIRQATKHICTGPSKNENFERVLSLNWDGKNLQFKLESRFDHKTKKVSYTCQYALLKADTKESGSR